MVKRKKSRSGVTRNFSARANFSFGGKLRAHAFANSLGLVTALGIISLAIISWLTSYTGASIVDQYPIAFSFNSPSLIIGIIESYVFAYIGGWIFVNLYNKTK